MAFYISANECLGCGVCAQDCPSNAIHQECDVFTIDSETCIDCGTCYTLCPIQLPRRAD